jgi:hypothetical protein
MSLARQVELMELDRQPPALARPASRGLLPAPKQALPAPQQQLALPAPSLGSPQGCGEGNNRRLSTEEMADRRRQGLCFNCNEQYTCGHNCLCRQIFFIDGVEIDDATDTTETAGTDAPCFSLQAVAGVAAANMMQIAVTLGPVSLVALLDSGSTHNFISATAAHRSGLPIQRRPRLTAMVANGEQITCAGVLRHAPLHVDGEAFPADLFMMPLAGYDVVLGTLWLARRTGTNCVGPRRLPHDVPTKGTLHHLGRRSRQQRAGVAHHDRRRRATGGSPGRVCGGLRGSYGLASQVGPRSSHSS